jgi:predicted deacylase
MQVREHRLVSPAPGTQRFLKSHHFGAPGEGEKIYLQASLHADELPGMLVLHHLQPLLAAAEAEGRIHGEIVLVPVANPIGLAQTLMHDQMGRFDFASGENFNRHHIDFAPQIQQRLQQRLTQDETHNTLLIRQAMAEALAGFKASTELQSLRQTLMSLAFDADVVLDLHCDFEAVVHLYTGTPLWPQCEPLARYLGAEATLLAYESGGQPFDEACSQTWWKLQASLGEEFPIPLGCLSVTVELRGEQSVSHEWAQQDAQGIFAFLQHRGVIDGDVPPLPELKRGATPLAGSESACAPHPGVIVFCKQPGDWVEIGDPLFEIIDPLNQRESLVLSRVSGVLYARENRRFATAGQWITKVAGSKAFKTGHLLGA